MLPGIFNIHLIWAAMFVFTTIMIFVGGLIGCLEPYLPQIISDAFRYGKAVRTKRSAYLLVRAIEIPKKNFLHFYIFASILTPFLLVHAIKVYFLESPAPAWLINGLSLVCTDQRSGHTSGEGVILATTLLMIQSFRRLYECLFVNVDSGSKMNLLHYIVGYVHYFCAGVGIFCEAPGFVPPFSMRGDYKPIEWLHISVAIKNISWYQWLAAAVFFWAWWHQFKAHKIFANLKRNNSGGHSIPHGDWFRYVSCPHYLAEIIIYLCLAVILGPRHLTGIVVFLWVLINQVVAAFMSHFWYQERFANYPKSRKAVIPFLL